MKPPLLRCLRFVGVLLAGAVLRPAAWAEALPADVVDKIDRVIARGDKETSPGCDRRHRTRGRDRL